jgi:hypothetical protein
MDWAKPLHRLGVRLARRMLGDSPASPLAFAGATNLMGFLEVAQS